MQVLSGLSDAVREGFVFAALGDANLDLQEREIRYLSISAYDNYDRENKAQAAAIIIPAELLTDIHHNIALSIFKEDYFFITATNQIPIDPDNVKVNLTINTNIIAASVGQRNTTHKMKAPVKISLAHEQVHNFKIKICKMWPMRLHIPK